VIKSFKPLENVMNKQHNSFVSNVLAKLANAFRANAPAETATPAMVESLEQRQMMSVTPMGASAATVVAAPRPASIMVYTDDGFR
jgi:hypothetical protein